MGGLSRYAGVAQLVAQLICNQWVAGSIPVASSTCEVNLSGDKRGLENRWYQR